MFNKNNIIPLFLIILASVASYFTIFDNEFVWDDHVFILDNKEIRSFENIPAFFTSDVQSLYRPLRSVQYTVMYSLFGEDVFWYHLHALLLHILVSITLFFIFYSLLKKKHVALIAAILFAMHPVHISRITNMTASFDVYGILFVLVALLMYIRSVELDNKRYKYASYLLFGLALFCSEEAIAFPLLVILYDFCFHREKVVFQRKINYKRYLGFVGIGLAYVFLRFIILDIGARVEEYLAGSFIATMMTMIKVYVQYLIVLIFPNTLSVYSDVAVTSLTDPMFLVSLLTLIVIILIVIQFYNPIVAFSLGFFFITLLPFSNILPLQNFMALRYLYLPSAGFCLFMAYMLYRLYNVKTGFGSRKIFRMATLVVFLLLIAFYGYKSYERNADWQDGLTLWNKEIQINPGNSRAHNNLGFVHEQEGRNIEALASYAKAVELNEKNDRAWVNLGVSLAKAGRFNESIDAFQEALALVESSETHNKLGLVYSGMKEFELAVESLEKAIALDRYNAKAHNDLGTVYGQIGRFDDAIYEFNDALIIDKNYAEAHYNLGIILDFVGEKELAQEEFNIAAALEPRNNLYQSRAR